MGHESCVINVHKVIIAAKHVITSYFLSHTLPYRLNRSPEAGELVDDATDESGGESGAALLRFKPVKPLFGFSKGI